MRMTRRDFLFFAGAGITLLILPKNVPANTVSIPVLMYHDISQLLDDEYTVSPSLFSAQMEWLYSEGYKTLFFNEALRYFEEGGEKAVIITFDDGYASFLDFAFLLLRAYGFKATINIIGQHAGSFIKLGSNRPLMSWDEYRYLTDSGLIDLGCHTFNLHSKSLLSASFEKKLEDDIAAFQDVLIKEIGKKTEIFAWPYGIYTRKSTAIVAKAGFHYILTSNEGYLQKGGNFLEIPRLSINNKIDLISFQQYLGEKI